MSRLLNALKEAQREREGDVVDDDATDGDRDSGAGEPGYFWTSMFLLMVVCGLIVGGFMLLRDAIHGSGF